MKGLLYCHITVTEKLKRKIINKSKNKLVSKKEEIEIDFIADDEELFDDRVDDEGRNIIINGEINDSTVDNIHHIIKWNAEDNDAELPVEERKPIKIHINSDGGLVSSVMSLIDVVMASKTPVYTIATRAYSAGFLLLLSGHKRFAFKNSQVLHHSGSVEMGSTVHNAIEFGELLKRQEEKIKNYVLERTSIPPNLYKKNYTKEWYLFSDDMVQYGIVDEILNDLSVMF